MKQPDRFALMVAKGFPYKQVRPQDLILASEAIRLLRLQHAAVVRIVNRQLYKRPQGVNATAYEAAISDIRRALAQYKKGKR